LDLIDGHPPWSAVASIKAGARRPNENRDADRGLAP
jgi:hypothetical protein